MSNKKQTAVEWLLEQINNPQINEYFAEEIEQAKQMEKEQMIDFADNYVDNCVIPNENKAILITMFPEEHYTQTYHAFKGELIQDEIGNLKPKNHGK